MCPASARFARIAAGIAALVLWPSMAVPQQPIDYGGYRPHYQGYGVDTPGGRGGSVCRVTTLSDAAWPPEPGSLRYCLERTAGPRFVVFEISGTINLVQGPLTVTSPFVTIAGQTAPSPGILIRGPGLVIDTHDVVVQHVRVRVGNVPGEPVGVWLRDDADKVVLDHISVSWSVWTAVAVSAVRPGHPPGRITMLDSIVAESLGCSGVNTAVPCDPAVYPHKGASNSRAIAIGDAWNNARPRVALVRNISANNNDRHPEIGGQSQTFLVNNLIYNPSLAPLGSIFFQDETRQGPSLAVVVGNVLVAGPTTPGHSGYTPAEYREDGPAYLVRVNPTVHRDSRIYLAGNYYDAHCGGTACLASPTAQWMLARDFMWEWQHINVRASEPPLDLDNLPLSSALPYTQVESHLRANAGARPLDRDPVDARIVREIATRSGSVPNRTTDKAGADTGPDGFPVLAVNRRPLQVPQNPHQAIDQAGRTRIEAWLEGYARALESSSPAPAEPPAPPGPVRGLRALPATQ